MSHIISCHGPFSEWTKLMNKTKDEVKNVFSETPTGSEEEALKV